jgi:predicted transcriptional regulator
MSRQPPRPTDAELEILTVLWSRGPSTVREVHESISRRKPTQYSTVLKFMQIMSEKGLVRRDEKQLVAAGFRRLGQEPVGRRAFGSQSIETRTG